MISNNKFDIAQLLIVQSPIDQALLQHSQQCSLSEIPAADMSEGALSAALMKAYKEGLGVDFALVCQGVTKLVHSQVSGLLVCNDE